MTRKPSIPMTPTALPKQRSPEETVLPCRPEGFQGYCDWYDAIPEALRERRLSLRSCRHVQHIRVFEQRTYPVNSRTGCDGGSQPVDDILQPRQWYCACFDRFASGRFFR